MDFTIQKPDMDTGKLAQMINYEPQFKDDSYIKPLGQDDYSKFHLFIEEKQNELKLKLHLDKNSGDEHDCEYESERVEREVTRIKDVIFSKVF